MDRTEARCYVCNARSGDGCHAVGGEIAECPRPLRQPICAKPDLNPCDCRSVCKRATAAQFVGMSDDDEPMAVYRGVSL